MGMTRLQSSLVSLTVASVSSIALAQSQPQDGLRLLVPLDRPNSYLVDLNDVVVHTWPSQYLAGHNAYVEPDGTLVRSIKWGLNRFHEAYAGGGVERMKLDGEQIWKWSYNGPRNPVTHHDIEVMPNGNVLMIAYEEFSKAEAVAHGRHPLLIDDEHPFRPDHIIEVRQTGRYTAQIVWEWHVWDHVIQDLDPTKANFGNVGNNPQLVDLNYPIEPVIFGDWNHMNSVDYDPVNDWIILSPRAQNEIWIVDHSTTTQEAAGHTGGARGKGGDLLYRWGNPAAYRKGGPRDQMLFGQHSPVVIAEDRPGAGNILVFNNNNAHVGGRSSVDEIELPLDQNGNFILRADGTYGPDQPVWQYDAFGFHSAIVSNCERLKNGNTLICAGFPPDTREVDPNGTIVWRHQATNNVSFQAHFVERSFWQRDNELSRTNGGNIEFDVLAGSNYAGQPYLVLGSLSGNTPGFMVDGHMLPLNVDSYFMTTFSDLQSPLFTSMSGNLDASGRAKAFFNLPGNILPPLFDGTQFDHAFLTIDPTTGLVEKISGAVRFEIVP